MYYNFVSIPLNRVILHEFNARVKAGELNPIEFQSP